MAKEPSEFCFDDIDLTGLGLDSDWVRQRIAFWKSRLRYMPYDEIASCVKRKISRNYLKIKSRAIDPRGYTYMMCWRELLTESKKWRRWNRRRVTVPENYDPQDQRPAANPEYVAEVTELAQKLVATLDHPAESIAAAFVNAMLSTNDLNLRKDLFQAILKDHLAHNIPPSTAYIKAHRDLDAIMAVARRIYSN